ncbi:MAG: transcriptional regulator [Planctomycetes bacterium]|nr:transcriptional regulator [Planctomycetota bacterium]
MPDERSSREYFVLTALGADRPGIVAEVTEFLHQHGCNVEESRMSILGGEFGLLLLVAAPAGASAQFSQRLAELEARSRLEVRCRPTGPPQAHRVLGALPYRVKTYALDHEGIIHAISQSLSQLGVNIVSASATSYPAPISGTPLFQMEMKIDVPTGVEIPRLRAALERVALQQNADIDLTPEPAS